MISPIISYGVVNIPRQRLTETHYPTYPAALARAIELEQVTRQLHGVQRVSR